MHGAQWIGQLKIRNSSSIVDDSPPGRTSASTLGRIRAGEVGRRPDARDLCPQPNEQLLALVVRRPALPKCRPAASPPPFSQPVWRGEIGHA